MKLKSQKGFALPVVLIILALGVIVGVIGNFQLIPRIVVVAVPIIPLPVSTSRLYDITNWNKYNLKSSFDRVSVSYPPDWTLEENDRGIILKGSQGEVEILNTDLRFEPASDNLVEKKDITLKLKKEKLKGKEFVYSAFTYSRSGLINGKKELGEEACLCILASYQGLSDRGLILQILETIEVKEE